MTIQEYNDIYKNSITKSMQIESSGGVTITNTNICSEQMSLEEALCSEENLIIGSCESACFKIRIADMNHNFEGETLTVYQMIMVDAGGDLLLESGDSDYILLENGDRISLEMVGVPVPYGKFKVLSDKPTNDRRWRDLTCYDAMYDILNTDVAEWYNSLTFPMTIKNFRDRFFNYLGITQDTVALVNDNFETQGGFSVSGSLSGKDVITSICELNGVFGHISRDGLFEYISLPSTDTIALDWYMDGTGAYEDYLVQKITGIVARSSEDDVGTTVGTDTNLYVVEDNPLIYGSEGTASLTTALTNLLNNVKDINYRPFNVDTYGNPMLPLGTNLTISTRNQTINSFLMTRVLSGIQSLKDSISAKGEKYRPTEVNSLRSETKRTKGIIHELINDVDELRSTITDLDNQTSSEIQQLSDEIVLKVDASGNIVKVALASNASEGSTFAVNADNIRFTAGSVMRFDANNIVINSTYFKVDQYGNLECTSGKIGNWTIRTSGLSYGMTAQNDYAHDGIFLSSSAMEVIVNYHNYNTHNEINRAGFFIKNHSGNTEKNIVAIGSGNNGTLGDITCGTTAGNHYTNMSGVNFIADANNEIGNVGFYTRNNNGNREMSNYFIDSNFTEFKVVYTNGAKGLATSDVSSAELGYLLGVTSNIQTQLNGKQATITGGATTIVSDNLTASKALVSNSNGKVAVSSVTATELGYVSGATSNIQGQIDGLGAKSVSGNPIAITDAEAMNANSVVATITPTQTGSGTPSPINVRPIVGFSSVDVAISKKNIINTNQSEWEKGTYNNNGSETTATSRIRTKWDNYIRVVPNETYTFSIDGANYQYFFCAYDENDLVVSEDSRTSDWLSSDTTITIQSAKRIRIAIKNTYSGDDVQPSDAIVSKIQAEIGSQATTYEPYQGKTCTVQLGDTYYGATIDVTRGVLRVEWGNTIVTNVNRYTDHKFYANISNSIRYSFNTNNLICDKFPTENNTYRDRVIVDFQGRLEFYSMEGYSSASDFMAHYGNIQVVWRLATPVEIQLTPQQIELLENNNTITTNVSSLDVTYQTNNSIGDTASALDKRVASIEDSRIYSTTEKIVGTWVDGKPLYEITMIPPSGSGSANTWINLGVVGLGTNIVDKVIKLFGAYTYQSEYFNCPNSRTMLDYVKTEDKMYYYNTGTNPPYPYFVTMQYTKA